ncbi:hypothetical protein HMPREF1864_00672 [Peptoniphilus sp. DNF00840]|nr:hypothetical protein HMPREF1864_00672 [Peptoniphilus sp. DNF00840]
MDKHAIIRLKNKYIQIERLRRFLRLTERQWLNIGMSTRIM